MTEPSLSGMVRFQSGHTFHDQHATTLVIHCSDGRYQAHIDEFLERSLKLESFDRLVVPGGPQFLFAASYLPKFEWAGRKWVHFLAKHHDTQEVICIAHEDCGAYKHLTLGPVTINALKDRQMADLKRTPAVLQEMVPNVHVQLFYARPSKTGQVEFIEV